MTFVVLKELFGKEGVAVIPKFFWMQISFTFVFFLFLKGLFSPFYLFIISVYCVWGGFWCFPLSLEIHKDISEVQNGQKLT